MTHHDDSDSAPAAAVRPYRPEDYPGVIRMIRSVYDEYRYVMDFDEFDRDLADIPSYYQDAGGQFWVLDMEGMAVGTIGAKPEDAETCELRRLYLMKPYRGRGYGRALIQTMLEWAKSEGFGRVVLWSDVLFERAHGLYTGYGFRATGKTRAVDPVNPTSIERFFVKELA